MNTVYEYETILEELYGEFFYEFRDPIAETLEAMEKGCSSDYQINSARKCLSAIWTHYIGGFAPRILLLFPGIENALYGLLEEGYRDHFCTCLMCLFSGL